MTDNFHTLAAKLQEYISLTDLQVSEEQISKLVGSRTEVKLYALFHL